MDLKKEEELKTLWVPWVQSPSIVEEQHYKQLDHIIRQFSVCYDYPMPKTIEIAEMIQENEEIH